MLYFMGVHKNQNNLTRRELIEQIIERARNRQNFYELILKLFVVCEDKGLRIIVENPYSPEHYLYNNFPFKPKVIDKNRQLRGDYFRKPTQYWFVRCEPTHGFTRQFAKITKKVGGGQNTQL